MYMQLRTVLKPFLQRAYHHEVVGVENIPVASGAILASNHVSFIDSIFLPLAAPRQVFFLAKSDYFTTPGLKGRLMKWFFTSVGQLPIDRSGGAKSAESLAAAVTALREGKLVGIYPEGTRSPDARLYRAKIGVARLALEAGVPIIPVAQFGNEDVQVPGSNRLRLRKDGKPIRVKTVIGQPIDVTPYLGRDDEWAAQRELADLVIERISQMIGRPITPVYAADVKKLMTAEGISADEATSRLLETRP
ncbi:1-acyl-sn-glycerol-3-phosphate acyltransferase [Rothia nasimurium]|uniref:1-acyl-sn-glycerol-3-phosphate acyltransferase n=1 Tax=Rothia nasimurium TaxID=85336 RepID=A0A4Y9F766_9MICC|nr:lysophospholipid acyltransferase family protein [Rothia nasimurium]MBF0807462.1 1-acyl-sn-glycerol-3-phosphate acyltransferase [Rothia nasimurium]TFU23758.1 1-acyl-sn-glycerol-3-phosphate acyltransferase [Rothia nasimurium]